MLDRGNIHCYADDSTVHDEGRDLVAKLDLVLSRISQWGSEKKTQVCALSFLSYFYSIIFLLYSIPFPTFRYTKLPLQDKLDILGLDICRDLNIREYIESVPIKRARGS